MSGDDTPRRDLLVTGGALQGALGAALFGPRSAEFTALGHIRVEGWLGSGGMGEVYLGLDERLGRRVALKTLSHLGQLSGERRQRFEREARVLASLDHPNICRLYGLVEGEHGDVLVLEYVKGVSLRTLCGTMPRGDALRLLRTLGEVLAATHAAQIVHRDLKPDNLMVTDDGALKVLDFGVARLGDDANPTVASTRAPSTTLTETGDLMGTLAYMAPEQLHRADVTSAADCYAFGLVMVELLTGQRVRGDGDERALRASVDGEVAALPALGDPALDALARALLAPAPEDRPTAQAIVAALDAVLQAPERRRSRRWRLVSGGLFGVALGGAALAGTLLVDRAADGAAAVCVGVEAPMSALWGPTQAATLGARIRGAGPEYAPQTADRVIAWLDEYTAAWIAMREEACRTHDAGLQSDTLYERRVACLESRAADVQAAVEVLTEDNEAILDAAVTVVQRLPPLDACADAAALMAEDPPPDDPALREALASEAPRRARVKALSNARRLEEGEAAASELVARAREIGHVPLLAEALYQESNFLGQRGRHKEAGEAAREAWLLALTSQRQRVAITAAYELATFALQGSRLDEAELWIQNADAWIQRRDPGPAIRSGYHLKLGRLRFEQGEPDLAAEEFERALALQDTLAGQPAHDPYPALGHLAMARLAQGRLDEADALNRRAAEGIAAEFGPTHPLRAVSLNNLAMTADLRGELAEEEALLKEVLAILEAAEGPEGFTPTMARLNLAVLALKLGRVDEAEQSLIRGAATMRDLAGPSSPEYLEHLGGLVDVDLARERYAEAIPRARELLGGFADGTASPDRVASAKWALARALWGAGQERAHSLALAREAAAALRGFGEGFAGRAEAIEAWVAERAACKGPGLQRGPAPCRSGPASPRPR
ncbi:MAG: serine/threonine-protein kinase [Nannocystaceae bacterium]